MNKIKSIGLMIMVLFILNACSSTTPLGPITAPEQNLSSDKLSAAAADTIYQAADIIAQAYYTYNPENGEPQLRQLLVKKYYGSIEQRKVQVQVLSINTSVFPGPQGTVIKNLSNSLGQTMILGFADDGNVIYILQPKFASPTKSLFGKKIYSKTAVSVRYTEY